jgi:hypothetical protein
VIEFNEFRKSHWQSFAKLRMENSSFTLVCDPHQSQPFAQPNLRILTADDQDQTRYFAVNGSVVAYCNQYHQLFARHELNADDPVSLEGS